MKTEIELYMCDKNIKEHFGVPQDQTDYLSAGIGIILVIAGLAISLIALYFSLK